MPSKTPKQKKFMAAVANSPKFAKKVGVPQSVGKEFAAADKAKEDAEELPVGHYDTHVRLQRGGKWNAHTVNVRKTDKKLIKKFLDQGFRIVKPGEEDYERFQNPYDDYVDDDAREQARRDDELMGDIKVDTDSIPKRPDLKRGMKDLDKKIKQMQFKDFFKKRNGK